MPEKLHCKPIVIPRQNHCISRNAISRNALTVLYRLKKANYAAFLVGGGVRDLLLGLHPKDFDIATDARPEQIAQLFSNCRLIGRRFRLAHIYFGRDFVEVATFRAAPPADNNSSEQHLQSDIGMLLRDNVYGTLEEDAFRRDFTINALYYNIADFSVIDYTNGMQDLNDRLITIIGDPAARYAEDPVRMLRAIRLSCKLNIHIAPDTAKPIADYGHLLSNIPPSRLFDEVHKMFTSGKALLCFEMLMDYNLIKHLFPMAEADNESIAARFIRTALVNTDNRVHSNKPINPAFLVACLLWHPFLAQMQSAIYKDMQPVIAREKALHYIINKQALHLAIPKRLTYMVRDIWELQIPLTNLKRRRLLRLLERPRFRAAYDFLLLRVSSGEIEFKHIANWWTQFLDANDTQRKKLLNKLKANKNGQ